MVSSGLNNRIYSILETDNRSERGPYPSDLDGVGCNQNGKTCPVAPVMAPRPESVRWILFISMFGNYNIKIFSIQRRTRWTKSSSMCIPLDIQHVCHIYECVRVLRWSQLWCFSIGLCGIFREPFVSTRSAD
jgi:hypothetical protein